MPPQPPGPAWLRDLAGIDFLADVTNVGLVSPVSDDDLKHLDGFHALEKLYIYGPEITDAGFAHVSGLRQLRELEFICPKVTDAGLEHLQSLRRLRILRIACSGTSAGVRLLAPLKSLETLIYLDSQGETHKARRAIEDLDIPFMGPQAFINVPLRDAADYFFDLYRVRIDLDKDGLGTAGIGADAPLTWSATNVTLRTALKSTLDPLGLDWTLGPEGLVITSKEAERARIAELRKTWPNIEFYVDQSTFARSGER